MSGPRHASAGATDTACTVAEHRLSDHHQELTAGALVCTQDMPGGQGTSQLQSIRGWACSPMLGRQVMPRMGEMTFWELTCSTLPRRTGGRRRPPGSCRTPSGRRRATSCWCCRTCLGCSGRRSAATRSASLESAPSQGPTTLVSQLPLMPHLAECMPAFSASIVSIVARVEGP